MTRPRNWVSVFNTVCITIAFMGCANAAQSLSLAGAACATPPVLHCPDSECPAAVVINPGPVVEMKTRRTYFLDYPCDLKKGEQVTFVLSLHGGGSYGNWQRHYFPMMDYKEKYRLVIATPNSPTRAWSEADDSYLQSIVEFVVGQIGKENIAAFWLVGHSQGGMTSNRIVRTDFFKTKVDGWLSLSGGRLGGNPGRSATFAPGPSPSGAAPAPAAASTANAGGVRAAGAALLRDLPGLDFSFIYAIGQREMDENGVPEASEWAKKYACGARQPLKDVVDTKPGYVYDGTRLNQLRPGWGLLPAPGKAQISVFPDCKDNRVVADAVRLDKGHTEGLEPSVTEELIKLMLAAGGGKIRNGG